MTTQINGDTGVSQCQPNSVSQDDLQSGVVGKGPAFFAIRSATIQFAHATWVVAPFDSYDFNFGNYFNVTTHRFTPLVAGYYQFNLCCQLTGTTGITACGAMVSKNNHTTEASNLVPTQYPLNVSTSLFVYMNGSTDYVEAFVRTEGSGNGALISSAATGFSGVLVRAA